MWLENLSWREEEWARDYVDWLALNNETWKQENQTKLNEFLGKTVDDIYTNYTFREKFAATNNKDEFDVFKFTADVVRDYEIVRYKNKIYAKDGLVWSSDGNKLLRMINQVRQLKKSQDAEVVHQIEKQAVEYEEEIRVIQLNNNYQIKDGAVQKGASEEFTPYLLNVSYDKDANKDVDGFEFLGDGPSGIAYSGWGIIRTRIATKGLPTQGVLLDWGKGSER